MADTNDPSRERPERPERSEGSERSESASSGRPERPTPSSRDETTGSTPGRDARPERSPAAPGSGREATTEPEAPAGRRPGAAPTPLTQQLGRVVLIAVAVLFGIFAVFNFQFVSFSWVFGETTAVYSGGDHVRGGIPLIVLLVVSFLLGALVGWLTTLRSRRKSRANAG